MFRLREEDFIMSIILMEAAPDGDSGGGDGDEGTEGNEGNEGEDGEGTEGNEGEDGDGDEGKVDPFDMFNDKTPGEVDHESYNIGEYDFGEYSDKTDENGENWSVAVKKMAIQAGVPEDKFDVFANTVTAMAEANGEFEPLENKMQSAYDELPREIQERVPQLMNFAKDRLDNDERAWFLNSAATNPMAVRILDKLLSSKVQSSMRSTGSGGKRSGDDGAYTKEKYLSALDNPKWHTDKTFRDKHISAAQKAGLL